MEVNYLGFRIQDWKLQIILRYFLGANPSVRIVVDRGHVELEGYVANRGDFNLMNILANGVSGVFSVKNNLVVEKEMIR